MSSARSAAAKSPPSQAKKSTALSPETVEYLKAWMMSPEHVAHPYPAKQEKADIMAETGISTLHACKADVLQRSPFASFAVQMQMCRGQSLSHIYRACHFAAATTNNSAALGLTASRPGLGAPRVLSWFSL